MICFICYFLAGLAILGVIYWIAMSLFCYSMLKKIFKKFPKDIQPIPGIKKEWQAFQRTDYSKWDRKKMLWGAFTRFPRNCFVIPMVVLVIAINIFLLGIPLDKISGKYRLGHRYIRILFRKIGWKAINNLSSITVIEEGDFPDSFDTPIIVANHINWFDAFYFGIRFWPSSIIAKKDVASYPIISTLMSFTKPIYVDRKKSTNREDVINAIDRRIKDFQTRQDIYDNFPIIIFPEGTNSNGRCLIRFKSGAFDHRTPITVFCCHYDIQNFQPGMDEINQMQNVILSQTLKNKLTVKYFKMTCGEKQTSEEYMNRCQLQMSQVLGYPCIDAGYREYLQYKEKLDQRNAKRKAQRVDGRKTD